MGSDEQKLAEQRLQAGAAPGVERVLELRDLLLDHLHPRRLLRDIRPGAEEWWADRDLDRVAADLRADPRCRRIDVGAGLRVPDRRWHLLLGIPVWAGPAGVGSRGWFNLIGLVAVVASVIYVSAVFLFYLLGLYNVHFIFNFAVKASAGTSMSTTAQHVYFAVFVVITIVAGLINVFSRHLISLVYNVSAWWNIVGVLAIVVILIAVPSHHASLSYVFSHKANEFGLQRRRGHRGQMTWFIHLPLGFLLTMYTITGCDALARARLRGATVRKIRAEGHLALGPLLGDIRLDRDPGDHVRDPRPATKAKSLQSGLPGSDHLPPRSAHPRQRRWSSISTVGQLFCGMACITSASRMTFAFSADGAVPGHNLWRPPQPEQDAHVGSAVRVRVLDHRHRPRLLPEPPRHALAFLAVTSISVIGLYIAYTIPVYLRWRAGDSFVPGRGRSAADTNGSTWSRWSGWRCA